MQSKKGKNMKESKWKKTMNAIDIGAEKTGIFLMPYGIFISNSILPGSGFWILGKTAYGFVNFFIAAVLWLLISAGPMLNPLEKQSFYHYFFLAFFSGCIALGTARNEQRKKNKYYSLERKQRKAQTFFSVIANIISPGGGLFMLGKYRAGLVNILMYYLIFGFWFILFSEFYLDSLLEKFNAGSEHMQMAFALEYIAIFGVLVVIANMFCGRVAYLMAKQLNKEDPVIEPPEVPGELNEAFRDVFSGNEVARC